MRRSISAIRRTTRAACRAHRDTGRLALAVGMILVRAWLVGRGLAVELADRFGSAFGRATAKAYRAVTGREPRRTWSVIGDHVRAVNGYLQGEEHILAAALDTYRPRDPFAAREFAAIAQPTQYATAA